MRQGIYARSIKRKLDILLSGTALVVLSPIMAVTAWQVRKKLGSPVLFTQLRPGKGEKIFKMYKFRTMTDERDAKGNLLPDEQRLTEFGKFLRESSLDELPELFNILKGDMSLVGPRPERPFFVEKFREEIPRYMIKHQVRPGMTGWAQINGYRGNTSIRKRIEYDLYYIENWTLGFDIKILFLTIFKGFIKKNAY